MQTLSSCRVAGLAAHHSQNIVRDEVYLKHACHWGVYRDPSCGDDTGDVSEEPVAV
jgi:hypothetical protein